MSDVHIRRVGVWLTVALVAVQTALHTANRLLELSPRLDVNGERTVFAALGASLLLLVALGAVLVWTAAAHRLRGLLVVAVVVTFFAADELLALHERAGVAAAAALGLSESWDSVLWPLLYLPLGAVVAVSLWWATAAAPAASARVLRVGLLLLLVSVAAEVLSAPFSTADTYQGTVHAVEGAFEEGLEVGGWGLVATGMLAWWRSLRARPVRRDATAARPRESAAH